MLCLATLLCRRSHTPLGQVSVAANDYMSLHINCSKAALALEKLNLNANSTATGTI